MFIVSARETRHGSNVKKTNDNQEIILCRLIRVMKKTEHMIF